MLSLCDGDVSSHFQEPILPEGSTPIIFNLSEDLTSFSGRHNTTPSTADLSPHESGEGVLGNGLPLFQELKGVFQGTILILMFLNSIRNPSASRPQYPFGTSGAANSAAL